MTALRELAADPGLHELVSEEGTDRHERGSGLRVGGAHEGLDQVTQVGCLHITGERVAGARVGHRDEAAHHRQQLDRPVGP